MNSDSINLPYEPNAAQKEGLKKLAELREHGEVKGVVGLPPGSGKTYLAALDTVNVGADNVLYLIHQTGILQDAYAEFRQVYGGEVGQMHGKRKDFDATHLFATVQTLYQARYLEQFDPNRFDYIILDEFHHSASMMFQTVLNYFNPDFVLGLTATPDRSDMGRHELLEICDGNLVLDWSVERGIEEGLLAPFTYHAFTDNIDYSTIEWNGYRYDEDDLEKHLFVKGRDQRILSKYRRHGRGRRTIGFCLNVSHADRMETVFREAGIRAAAAHSRMSDTERENRIQGFRSGDFDIIFVVDIFNEGVNFPEASCLLFLRPTYTERVFWQQLGRGLRTHPGKDRCVVLDFVGNHRKAFTAAEALGLTDNNRLRAPDQERDGKPVYTYAPDTELVFEPEAVTYIDSRLYKSRSVDGYSEEYLREEWNRLKQTLGQYPKSRDWREQARCSVKYIEETWGSWRAFAEAMEPDYSSHTSRDVLEAEWDRLKDVLGRAPTVQEWETHGRFTAHPVERIWGKWSDFVKEMEPGLRRKGSVTTKEEIRAEYFRVKSLVADERKVPTLQDWKTFSIFSATPVRTHYGTWTNLKQELDPDYAVTDPEEELIKEYRRLQEELGKSDVTTKEWDRYAFCTTGKVYVYWDGWLEFKEAAKNR